MGERGGIGQDLLDLVDQIIDLSPVQWGCVLITAAAAFVWIWVMGAPKEQQRPAAAGGAAVLAGLVATLALVLVAPHRPA